jgi:hypothetical protein
MRVGNGTFTPPLSLSKRERRPNTRVRRVLLANSLVVATAGGSLTSRLRKGKRMKVRGSSECAVDPTLK